MKQSALVLVILATLLFANIAKAQMAPGSSPDKGALLTNLVSMPMTFTANYGQWNGQALFKAEAGGATFWFCRDEVVYQFGRNTDEPLAQKAEIPGVLEKFNHPRFKKELIILRAQFVGANPNPEIFGEDRLPHNCNYFYGNDASKWTTDVPNYSSVIYKDIYPGIDLKYHGNGRGMKYDFIVKPGADLSRIRIHYDGAANLAITSSGDLEAVTGFGPVHENIPEIYQLIGSRKVVVSGRYKLIESGIFGFEADDYDPAYPLVIDPELVYSTYLGGNSYDLGEAIAVDNSGCAYVAGSTYSTNFPTSGPYQSDQDSLDVFVTKFSSSGNNVVYSTYLGGYGDDHGYSIAVDNGGFAYVSGYTSSIDFPTVSAYQTEYQGGGYDAFVTKLSASGNSLAYSTYLGGEGLDQCYDITLDGSRNAYITGSTNSISFPTLAPYQTYQGQNDGFVIKLSSSGSSLIYGTYLGGSSDDYGVNIAVDGSGSAYVTGWTYSIDFPTLNPYQTYQGPFNMFDAFLTKLSPSGNSLSYSTYLAGNGWEVGYGVVVGADGSAYVSGATSSSNFPTQNPFQTDQPGLDGFVTRVSPVGNSLYFSTYLGGNDEDRALRIALDDSGCACVAGFSFSTDFPTMHSLQTDQPSEDAFIIKLSQMGNSLQFGTYLGGDGQDYGIGIALDTSGLIYCAGYTTSMNFPTYNAYQTYQGPAGNYDAFVTKISDVLDVPRVVSVFPQQNARNVPDSTNISVTFNTDMDIHSMGDSTVLVNGSYSGHHYGSFFYNSQDLTFYFGPSNDFVTGEIVTTTIKGSILSYEGIPMDSSFTWSFTIEADSGTAVFDSSTFTPTTTGVYWVVAADLNGDDCLDMASANTDANTISVFFNDCDRSFTLNNNYGTGSRPRTIVAADFNNDNHIDLATANSGSRSSSVYFNDGDGTFTLHGTYPARGLAWGVQTSDFDGDGDIDLGITGGDSGTVAILMNDGYGNFPSSPSQIMRTGEGAVGIFINDFNQDNCPDMAVTSGDPGSILIYDNNGDGSFPELPSGSYESDGSSWGIFAADFNGDYFLDIAVTNPPESLVSVIFNDQQGNYPVINGSYETDGSAWGIFCADLNNDGFIDMAVSNADNGIVSVFLNNGDGTFNPTPYGSYETNGSGWGLFSADMDGDGAMDLIVSNSNGDGITELWNEPFGYYYVPGDVNNSGNFNGLDVVFSVSYFKGGPAPVYSMECPAFGGQIWHVSGDVNASCNFNGLDVSYMVSYLKGGPGLQPCADCPPLGRLEPPIPGKTPIGVPVLKSKTIIKPTD